MASRVAIRTPFLHSAFETTCRRGSNPGLKLPLLGLRGLASTPFVVRHPATGLVLGEVRIIKGRGLMKNSAVASTGQNLDHLGDKPRRGLVNLDGCQGWCPPCAGRA